MAAPSSCGVPVVVGVGVFFRVGFRDFEVKRVGGWCASVALCVPSGFFSRQITWNRTRNG